MRIRSSQIQHPVGQGGFHTGWLYRPPILARPWHLPLQAMRFAWIYDCGSNQTAMLTREIDSISGATFNVLFLSHLDTDHVNGVDKLLLNVENVAEVVLPYLGDDEWALHLAAAAVDGALSGALIDLATDPAGWFGARGVGQVTYVEGNDDDDPGATAAPDPIDPDRPERGEREDKDGTDDALGGWSIAWTRRRAISPAPPGGLSAAVAVLPRGSVGAVQRNGAATGWVLSPFAFKPSAARLHSFSAQLTIEFGPNLTAAQYASHARSSAGREKLKRCYKAAFVSSNLHSMALYSGPEHNPNKLLTTAWQGAMVRRVVQPGWLSTGDVDLTVAVRRNALTKYYSRYAALVGQLSLPHHGSDLSFDPAFLTSLPNLNFGIAAVGANIHGHPGLTVQNAVAAAPPRTFIRVDENPSSSFRVDGVIDF